MTFFTLLLAAIFRALCAEGAGRQLEIWFAARFPNFPEIARVIICVIAGVILVESAWIMFKALARGVKAALRRIKARLAARKTRPH